ncbi:MAG: glycosyltransferase [Candidatus Bathyarchaeia archaeon]|jgi:glycosyltransferase involved in cell wall biosynthesis
MKVFAYLPSYLSSGGSGVNERKLLEHLTSNAFSLVFTVNRENKTVSLSELMPVCRKRTKIIPFSRWAKPAFIFDIFFAMLLSLSLVFHRLMGGDRYDVIYVRSASEAIGFSFLKKLHGVPVVLKLMSFRSDEYFMCESKTILHECIRYFLFQLEKVATLSSQAIIAPSLLFKKELICKFNVLESKISTLGVGVDLNFFDNAKDDVSSSGSTFTIGYVGSLIPLNDLSTLLKALKVVNSTVKTKLLILTRDDSSNLKKDIFAQNLSSLVKIESVPHNEVPTYMSRMDIIIIPRRRLSSTELVLPLKLFEAGASRRPIIIARTRLIEEMLTDNVDVVMYTPEDSVDLAQKIVMLSMDKSLRNCLSINLFEFVKYYDWQKVALIFQNILTKISSMAKK